MPIIKPKVQVHVKIFGKKGAKETKREEKFKHGSNLLTCISSLGYQQNDQIFCVKNRKLTIIINPSEIKILESSSFVIVRKDGKLPIKCTVTFLTEPQDTYDLIISPSATLENLISYLSLLQDKFNVNSTHDIRGTDNVIVLADWIEDEDELELTITYNENPLLRYKIFSMSYYMGSPSKYAKNPEEAKKILRNKRRLICDHRDGDNSDDVTLYYPGFQRFIDQCNDAIPTREEYTLIQHMCTYMSKYMPKGRTRLNTKGKETEIQPETIRQDIFIKLMNQFLKTPIETKDDDVKKFYENDTPFTQNDTQHFPNGMMEKGGGDKMDGYINPCKCVILEVKNESGQGGGSDSHSQVIAYYVQSLEGRKPDKCPAPAFLLELVGPHLFISGAVYGRYVFVDRLVDPVWLVPQNQKAMIRIAQIFKALKDAVTDIREYYKSPNPIGHDSYDRYPIVKLEKQDAKKTEIIVNYTEAIEANMFKGTVANEDVIIYFVTSSSRERFIQQHALIRQEIKEIATVKETLNEAIIMKHKDDVTSFSEYLKKCKPLPRQ